MNIKCPKFVRSFLRSLLRKGGQTLVEYGLILVLISVSMFAVLFLFQDSLGAIFGKITQTLSRASGS